LHLVLLDFQESVTSPAAQQGADGDKAGDAPRVEADTAATTQNPENAAQSKETGGSKCLMLRMFTACKECVAGPDS